MPSDPAPKLPMWIFFATDAALRGAAAVISVRGERPLSASAMLLIAACVICGAIVVLLPIIVHFERQKNEAIDERQRALEALARTVESSAEQIGIAVSGLHQVAELAQKNLKHAEQLPHKLQDKIAGFQSRIENSNEAEREEREKELLELRTAETERLEAVAAKIARSTAEFARLETATQQHLTLANEAIAKLSFAAAATIGKAQVAAEQAFAHARTEAARGLGESAGQAARAIESAKIAALAEVDRKLAATESNPPTHSAVESASKAEPAGSIENPTPPPKRFRKVRSAEAPTGDALGIATPHPQTSPPTSTAVPGTAGGSMPATPSMQLGTSAPHEPKPIPSDEIAEIIPVVPPTAEPFSGHIAREVSAVQTPVSVSRAPVSPPLQTAPAPRVRVADQKPKAEAATGKPVTSKLPDATKSAAEWADEVGAPAEGDSDGSGEDSPASTEVASEQVLSSDGATRLLVTAYIGIGNRLFIRGAGPGLSWEKGVPLQFVSIGKWRWETHDASTSVRFKIYKNDELECTALGARTLLPGYQREVTAAF
ncbi:MAG: hypothetical protein ABIZ49_09295 [Opitutaceae bacterium]